MFRTYCNAVLEVEMLSILCRQHFVLCSPFICYIVEQWKPCMVLQLILHNAEPRVWIHQFERKYGSSCWVASFPVAQRKNGTPFEHLAGIFSLQREQNMIDHDLYCGLFQMKLHYTMVRFWWVIVCRFGNSEFAHQFLLLCLMCSPELERYHIA